MIRRPPRSTRTDTLFPYTTLFRSEARHGRTLAEAAAISGALTLLTNIVMAWNTHAMQRAIDRRPDGSFPERHLAHIAPVAHRSEARRVGEECVSTFRSRRSPYH